MNRRLYRNPVLHNVKAEETVLSFIEKAMDKYLLKFKLLDLIRFLSKQK